MLADIGLLALGSLLLYLGAEWLVRGAAGLARAFGVSPLVVGLTVVSYGTSAPELVVSVVAASQGKGPIALGNVVGSNIANIGLILGVTALIAPPRVEGTLIRRELPLMALATFAVPLSLVNGVIGRVEAAVFFFAALAFTFATLRWTKQGPTHQDSAIEDDAPPTRSKLGLAALAVVGLGILLAGGKLFVTGAVGLALRIGMSEHVVGLTVVAVGTSLPELAASLVAALRGHSEIAVGNVVGSNIFNLLLILGAAALLSPIHFALRQMWIDTTFLIGLTLLCIAAMRTGRVIRRWEGGVFVAGYVVFITAVVLAG